MKDWQRWEVSQRQYVLIFNIFSKRKAAQKNALKRHLVRNKKTLTAWNLSWWCLGLNATVPSYELNTWLPSVSLSLSFPLFIWSGSALKPPIKGSLPWDKKKSQLKNLTWDGHVNVKERGEVIVPLGPVGKSVFLVCPQLREYICLSSPVTKRP